MRMTEKEFIAELEKREKEKQKEIDAAFECKIYLPKTKQPKKKKILSTKLLKRDFSGK